MVTVLADYHQRPSRDDARPIGGGADDCIAHLVDTPQHLVERLIVEISRRDLVDVLASVELADATDLNTVAQIAARDDGPSPEKTSKSRLISSGRVAWCLSDRRQAESDYAAKL
jgi:hypothetical protein